jgi:hypothetical protein
VSKGLGDIQRTVVEALSRIHRQRVLDAQHLPPFHARLFNSDDAAWVSIRELVKHVFHSDPDDDNDREASRSELVSIHRAVASLETRGLVEVKIVKYSMADFGGANRYKAVRLVGKH